MDPIRDAAEALDFEAIAEAIHESFHDESSFDLGKRRAAIRWNRRLTSAVEGTTRLELALKTAKAEECR